ncbi:unnamed protein product [Lactuca virosa]|uniref:Aminotransferase-like plant mobile domain-containing protein n=1 Tax=Lactuca virosa TaxID=75947 RepID=A0AAU9LI96_9ASTR|nr:unnamed protein product [Lactuca virosa]
MAHHPPLAQPGSGAAPNHRRSRNPRGPVAAAAPSVAVTGAHPLLKLASAFPFRTIYHFLNSSPGWIPIVSQLYVSVLWVVHILRVSVNHGHGALHHSSLLNGIIRCLGIDWCMIPGPLVSFFESIAAVNGPFDWIADILPRFPSFHEFWDNTTRSPSHNYARQIPFPALMLDQLARFGASVPDPGQDSNYTTFQWYSNVFNIDFKDAERLYFVGPQTCGSLFVSQSQHDIARNFWASVLGDFTRLHLGANQPNLTNFKQVLGFATQNGTDQIAWFPKVAIVMEKYSRYFKESVPLKSIITAGIGSTSVRGRPKQSAAVSRWLYPPDNQITPFTSTRFQPLRPIPNDLDVTFSHAHHEIEELAERYAIISFTNINWSKINNDNDKFFNIEENALYTGDYWKMFPHRTGSFSACSISSLYANVVASKYHVNYL